MALSFRKSPEAASNSNSIFTDDSVPAGWKPPVDNTLDNNIFNPVPDAPENFEPISSPGVPGATHNVLNSDVSVVGTLRFTDDLLVDGTVEGEITSDGELTIGANAVIQAGSKNEAAIRTRSAIIQGRVTGDVVVTDRVELTSTAELVGNVTASKISIQEGAVFIGHCMVGVASASSVPTTPPAKKVKTTKPTANNMFS